MQFLISHLPRCLRTRRFSEPTLRPSGATKQSALLLFYLFARLDLLSFDLVVKGKKHVSFVYFLIFLGFRGKPAYAPVCIAAMAVTKADRIQSRKAAVETDRSLPRVRKKRQALLALLKEIEEDKLNNELKEKRRREECERRAAAKSEGRSKRRRKCRRPKRKRNQPAQPLRPKLRRRKV